MELSRPSAMRSLWYSPLPSALQGADCRTNGSQTPELSSHEPVVLEFKISPSLQV